MSDRDIINQALNILESNLQKPDCVITKPEDANAYLKLKLSTLEYETFGVMFLNTQHGLIRLQEMFRGSINSATVYPREVVKAALHFNAAAVILTHNHPSGVSEPSQADRHITQRLVDALGLIDVRVLDHIIVGGNETYSFAEHHLL